MIGATTENPSFSLNSALLSRCRVIVLEKLSTENVIEILKRSLGTFKAVILDVTDDNPSVKGLGFLPKLVENKTKMCAKDQITNLQFFIICRVAVEESSIKWLAEICDGDARIALNSLQLAMESILENDDCDKMSDLKFMSLNSIKDGIKVSFKITIFFVIFRNFCSLFYLLSSVHTCCMIEKGTSTMT